MVIFITDGTFTDDTDSVQEEAAKVREIARVLSVGITDMVETEELSAIASSPDDVFILQSYSDLKFILDPIMAFICLQGALFFQFLPS